MYRMLIYRCLIGITLLRINMHSTNFSMEVNRQRKRYLLNLPGMYNSNLTFEQAFQEFVDVVKSVDKRTPVKLASR